METIRWIISFFVAVPAGVCSAMNFGLACRSLLYFTSRGPSPIPILGGVFAIIGLVVVPKTGTLASRLVVAAFVLFLLFEASHPIATCLNGLREKSQEDLHLKNKNFSLDA